jgi:hypothetical protein
MHSKDTLVAAQLVVISAFIVLQPLTGDDPHVINILAKILKNGHAGIAKPD